MRTKISVEKKTVALALARFGFPIREITEATGLSARTISGIAIAEGLRRRRKHPRKAKRVPTADRRAIIARARAGESYASIAAHTGYATNTISNICVLASIRRRRSRAAK